MELLKTAALPTLCLVAGLYLGILLSGNDSVEQVDLTGDIDALGNRLDAINEKVEPVLGGGWVCGNFNYTLVDRIDYIRPAEGEEQFPYADLPVKCDARDHACNETHCTQVFLNQTCISEVWVKPVNV